MTPRFRSATIHEGLLRAPTRAFLQALGQDDDEIDLARAVLTEVLRGR